MNKWYLDIRSWILLFFIIRLFGITDPPLETAHNWRQSTVNMVARNFLEEDPNIFYPRVDMAGEKTGITGMEFPLLNYLIYGMSTLFGYDHWYGRLLNLIVSSFGVLYFSKVLRELIHPRIAFFGGIILLSSLWFSYSRKIMPDTFAVSLVIIAFYHGVKWLRGSSGILSLFLYALVGTLGVLSKLPSGVLFILMIPLLFMKGTPRIRSILFLTTSGLMLLPVGWWYFYWVPHLVEEYGYWHFFMGKDIGTGFRELIAQSGKVAKRFYSSALQFSGSAAFVGGLAIAIIKRERRIWLPVLIGFLAFSVVMLKAGSNFPRHTYYIIPFIPVMVIPAAYALSTIKRSWVAFTLLALISIEGVANQQHDFRTDKDHIKLLELEKDLDKVSDQDDLILINSGENPTPMYFAHREGWVATKEEILKPGVLEVKMKKGCEYLVVLKRSFGEPFEPPHGKLVLSKDSYSIYTLQTE